MLSSQLICPYISSILWLENRPFHNIILAWTACCIKSHGICPNFYHSFSEPSLCTIAFKITMKSIFIVLSGLFFLLTSLSVAVALFIISVSEIRTANIHRMPIRSPMLAIKEALGDHNTQIYNLSPTILILICDFSWVVWCDYWLSIDYYLCSWHKCDQVFSRRTHFCQWQTKVEIVIWNYTLLKKLLVSRIVTWSSNFLS